MSIAIMRKKVSDKKILSGIRNILIFFPTNVGDTVLAFPVLDKIKANYPQSNITAIASPKTKDFILRNNSIDEVILFNKHWSSAQKRRFAFSLRGKYDFVIDLKNSFLPAILKPKFRTSFLRFFPKDMHIRDKYLALIEKFTRKGNVKKCDIVLSPTEKSKWEKLQQKPSIFIACSSLTLIKSYPHKFLEAVVRKLIKKYPVTILGSDRDSQFYKNVLAIEGVVGLVGKTTISDVFYILKKYCLLLLAVDSSILHMGSYLGLPTVAIFGPTHPDRSHPYSINCTVLRNQDLACVPCEKSQCSFKNECMDIEPKEVIQAIAQTLDKNISYT